MIDDNSPIINQITKSYPRTLLKMCKDKTIDDDWWMNNLDTYHQFFENFVMLYEFSSIINQDVVKMAAEAHVLFEFYLHLHVINRLLHKQAGFTMIDKFGQLKNLFEYELCDIEDAKRTLNRISIGKHLEELREALDTMVQAEPITKEISHEIG
jgi:hypothetical protein